MTISTNTITQAELASRLNVTPTTIQIWNRKQDWDDFIGPFPDGEKQGTTKIYTWKVCLQWYIKYIAFTQFKSLYSASDKTYAQQKEEGDARKSLASAQLVELELQQAQGKLIPSIDIEDSLTNVVLTIRQKILTITPRLKVLLTLSDEQSVAVERETMEILRELAEYKNVQ